jgi:hypothetical protein
LKSSYSPGNLDREKPDIIQTAEREGIELKQRGRTFWARCPFHDDRTPSFAINPEKQSFRCYGCGKYGDVISLIMELRGLSFRDAMKHLGMTLRKATVSDHAEISKRRMVKAFRKWERSYYGELADTFRTYHRMTMNLKRMEEAERLAWIFHELPLVEYRLDVLFSGTDEEKYNLFQEVKGNEKF